MNRTTPRKRLLAIAGVTAVMVVGLALCTLIDRSAFHAVRVQGQAVDGREALAKMEGQDWYRLLRVVGYWPTWGAAALALGFVPRLRRGAIALAISSGASGLAAELLKLIVGRQRPINNGVGEGEYVFKPFLSGFRDGSNLGMPSSHAAVAFGAAFAVLFLWRGPGLVVLVLAAGCGLTRMLAGAHFLSDVFVGAALGYACARLAAGRGSHA